MFRAVLWLALLLVASPASAAWREASSKHFVIYSEEKPEALKAFAERLERYDAAMRYLRGLPDPELSPANRLTVYVVSDLNAVQRIFGEGKAGRNVAGFYLPYAIGPVAIIPRRTVGGGSRYDLDSETVLLHEYAHHFLYANYAFAYPAWFSEGYAEFHSTARFEDDGSVGIGLPAGHRSYELIASQDFPMEKLLQPGTSKLNGEELSTFYGRAWLLTHYLSFEPKRKGQLASYLQQLNAGKPAIEAAKVFGEPRALGGALNSYLRRNKMPYLAVKASALKTSPVRLRDLSAAENAVMPLRIRSKRGVNPKSAAEIVQGLRKAAAPYPNDVFVQATLAEAETDANNYKEAEAAADRALAADPKSIEAMIWKARARMGAIEAEKLPATAWKDTRALLVSANRLDPNDPEPLILYYNSFKYAGITPTANSVVGLVRAHELAPQDRGLRFQVAQQLMVDGKAAEAKQALAPLAYDPHSGSYGERMTGVLAELEKGNTKAALALLQKADAESENEPASED